VDPTGNVASGGLFVRTRAIKLPGTRLRVRLTVPGLLASAELETVVRWVRALGEASEASPLGMGLQFVALPPVVQNAVERFMTTRDPMVHEVD
jgi:uncharacterized protein (TIGR02266 family)